MKSRIIHFALMALAASVILQACKGKTGPAGAPYTPPAPLCASPSQLGQAVTSTTNTVINANYLIAVPVTVASATTAVSIATYSRSGAVTGQVRMGIYNDNGGVPGNLVVQGNPVNLVSGGWATAALPNVYLPAATYWMCMLFSNTNLCYHDAGAGAYRWVSYDWAALPLAFPSTSTSSNRLQLFMYTCP
jgi:hypothetical protein